MLESLERRGWRECLHDVRCAGVQLDIVGRAPSGTLTIVEVKMQTELRIAHVNCKQRARLGRAALRLAECEPVQLALALVENEKVTLLPLDGF